MTAGWKGMRLTAAVPLLALAACSTIVMGRQQDITVTSSPPGAACQLYRNDAVIAVVPQTPAVVRIDRDRAPITTVCRHAGHGEARQKNSSGIEAMVFGNVLIGGLLGWGIDVISGADSRYSSRVEVALVPVQAIPAETAPAPVREIVLASQAAWAAQRSARLEQSNQSHTSPVGYVAPPPQPVVAAAPVSVAPPLPAAKPVLAAPRGPAPTLAGAMQTASSLTGGQGGGQGGGWRAHLASHRSETAAINEWQELLKSNPGLYGQFDPQVGWVELPERGSFARLELVGFAARQDADAACAKLRAATRYCAPVQD